MFNVTIVSVGHHDDVDGIEHIQMLPLPLPINIFEVQLKHYFLLSIIVESLVDMTYSSHFLTNLTREPIDPNTGRTKYDVVVLDGVWYEHLLPLIHRMKVPFMFMSTSYMKTGEAWSLNQPMPLSYFNYNGFPEPLSLMDRASNALINLGIILYYNNFLMPIQQSVIQKYFPDSPPIVDIQSNASFVMNNVHPALQDNVPSMPALSTSPTPKLESIMDMSGEAGVIYFSMGTFIKDQWIPKMFLDNLVMVLSELPKNNYMELQGEHHHSAQFSTSQLGSTTRYSRPSQSSPVHQPRWTVERARSFLSRLSSPRIPHAANVAVRQGFGQQLDWRTATSGRMRHTIRSMLNDTRYKMAANRVSTLMKDVLMPPTELAAYWIEYVCRHKGLRQLDHNNKAIGLFRYLLLDVVLVMAAVATLSVAFICWTTKRLALIFSNGSERIINWWMRK